MTTLAILLSDGVEGVPPDPPRAVELYRRAVEEGEDVKAMNNLGVFLHHGAELCSGKSCSGMRVVHISN